MHHRALEICRWVVVCLILVALPAGHGVAEDTDSDGFSNYQSTPVNSILDIYERLSGKHLVRDSNLSGVPPLSLNAKGLNKADLLKLIEATLLLNGVAIVPVDANTVKIVTVGTNKNPRSEGVKVYSDPAGLPLDDEVVSYYMPLNYVSAQEAQTVFTQTAPVHTYGAYVAAPSAQALVLTESTSVIRQLIAIKDLIDVPPASVTTQFIQLNRADAEKVSDTLTKLLDSKSGTATAGQTQASGSGSVIVPPDLGNTAPLSNERNLISGSVQIIPDTRSNRLLVITRPVNMPFLKDLIDELDQSDNFAVPERRELKYVLAQDILPALESALAQGKDEEDQVQKQSSGTSTTQNQTQTPATSNSGGSTSNGTSSNITSQTITWASQPGAIRTYNTAGLASASNDNFLEGYKLYSSSVMTATDETKFVNDVEGDQNISVPTAWQKEIGQYVDLNQSANGVYPIIDPRVLSYNANGFGTPNGVTAASGVAGFSVNDTNNTYSQNLGVDATSARLSMPVEWLYELQDGTFAPGVWQSDGSIKVGATGHVPSATNPIVGRVAFWTDDESSKVNINTASEGLYWDQPRVNTTNGGPVLPDGSYTATSVTSPDDWAATATDQGLGFIQPGINEFNHFPGHPATTSLSAVFSELTPLDIFSIVPRLGDKSTIPPTLLGSAMGTISIAADTNTGKNVRFAMDSTLNSDRLYASAGEILLQADRTLNSAKLNAEMVQERQFFITASSSAPELNLFGRPRVAMWPVSAYPNINTTWRTAYDSLVAFCSTIQNSSGQVWPFVFGRKNAYSQTDDATAQVAAGTFTNNSLYTYLQDVTSRPVPGFGGILQAKYGSSEMNQILTEALDYIRCTNIFDITLEPPTAAGPYAGGLTTGNEFTNAIGNYVNSNGYGLPGHGQVVPLRIGSSTQGLGRTCTVGEVALAFICTGDSGILPSAPANGLMNSNIAVAPIPPATLPASAYVNNTLGGVPLTATAAGGQRNIQAALLVQLDSPMVGYPHLAPSMQVNITGADQFTLNGTSLGFPGNDNLLTNQGPQQPGVAGNWDCHGFSWFNGVWSDGYTGFGAFFFMGRNALPRQVLGATTPTKPFAADVTTTPNNANILLIPYPFISNLIRINTPASVYQGAVGIVGSTMTLSSATLTLTVGYAADGNHSNHPLLNYQTVHVNFIGGAIPIPCLATCQGHTNPWAFNQDGFAGYVAKAKSVPGNPAGRMSALDVDNGAGVDGAEKYLFFPGGTADAANTSGGDVVRSMHLIDGDFRITTAMRDVPASRFVQAGTSLPATTPLLHTLTQPFSGTAFTRTTVDYVDEMQFPAGRVVDTSHIQYDPENAPAIPAEYKGEGPWSTGDFDNGLAGRADGPFANMPDIGAQYSATLGGNTNSEVFAPYYYLPDSDRIGRSNVFSPNRQIPSSGMLGSLPTGVIRDLPWQTLHFRPQESGTPDSLASAPDHLFMDLFWMPVVQPYAISNTFSTAGKINMNYQIMPFTYINRQTGLYAVLKAERMLTISSDATTAANYKLGPTVSGYNRELGPGNALTETGPQYRPKINIGETLKQFDNRFNGTSTGGTPEIFSSATQICDMYLVPDDGSATADNMESYWKTHSLTGDNSRERPYTVIYPRLTVQSNTFRVHYWVQTLKKAAVNTDPTLFIDPDSTYKGPKDVIRAQQRGNYVIERYLPVNDQRFGTSVDPTKDSLNGMYKIRVLSETEFNP